MTSPCSTAQHLLEVTNLVPSVNVLPVVIELIELVIALSCENDSDAEQALAAVLACQLITAYDVALLTREAAAA
jgi:hypothetical protein